MAKSIFDSLDQHRQEEIQMLLAAAGWWPNVAGHKMGPKLFGAIQGFERSAGLDADGILTASEFEALRRAASPQLALWGLRHAPIPGTGLSVWIPEGLGLTRKTTSFGASYESVRHSVYVMLVGAEGLPLSEAYQTFRSEMPAGTIVEYEVIKDGFFVLVGQKAGAHQYTRLAVHRGGVAGFTLMWADDDLVHGERLVTLMSDLFRSEAELGAYRSPPTPVATAVATRPAPEPAAAPSPPASPGEGEAVGGSGTGFFVSEKAILTNAHVVEGCRTITATFGGRTLKAELRALDKAQRPRGRRGARAGLQGCKPPARRRPGRGRGRLRISLAGRPSLVRKLHPRFRDRHGRALRRQPPRPDLGCYPARQQRRPPGGRQRERGRHRHLQGRRHGLRCCDTEPPQSLNFAIRASVATVFLEANGIGYTVGQKGQPIAPEDLAAKAKGFAAALVCTP